MQRQHSIHYVSYDRFPVPKGASVHIDAFVRGLSHAFGDTFLTTVAANSERSMADGGPDSVDSHSTEYSNSRYEYCPSVWHRGIPVVGRNVIERAASFRRQLLESWQRCRVVHFRSIYEGYPIARDKQNYCDRIVFEVNGLPSIELKYHYPKVADDLEFLAKLKHQEQVCLDNADLVVTVSQVNAEHLIYRGVDPAKIRVIPNGVDVDKFSFREPQSNWDCPRMIYVGTLAAWQGIRVAIEALALYRRDAPANLTVIGDGRKRQREALWKLAEKLDVAEHIELLSAQSQDELVPHYHGSHCAIAPLLANDRNKVQGCCPLKVLEAMACGTPLIASDLAVTRCLARNGVDALLVKPGSAKAIKDAMFRLRDEPRLGVRLSASARRRVKQHFTWRDAQQALVDVYRDLE